MLATHAYTTRLFTTMSADEMTVDPEFVLDEGLGDVSNLHSATAVTECDPTHFESDARQRLELPDGTRAELRAARPSGTDAERCASRGGWLAAEDAGAPDANVDAGVSAGGGGGCAAGAHGSRAALLATLVALAALVRRRR